jgi:hypothetical protein
MFNDESNIKLSVEIKLSVNGCFLCLNCIVPPEYPSAPIRFTVGDSFKLDADKIETIK